MTARREVQTLVAKALERHNNDRALAHEDAVQTVESNSRLRLELIGCMVWDAIGEHIRHQLTAQRARSVGRKAHKKLREKILGFMDFPLQDGTRLRAATGRQVSRAAEVWIMQAARLYERGLWLRLIAKEVGDSETVESSGVTEDRLRELWEDACERANKIRV